MAAKNPPEITLELSGGSLTIRTSEAIYRVVVAGGGVAASATALPAGPQPKAIAGGVASDEADDWGDIDLGTAPPVTGTGRTGDEDAGLIKATYDPSVDQEAYNEYYRDLSNDMYREIGSLAKRLSMSIRDVGSVNVQNMDLTSTGQQLEDAKGELQDVVKMTEQATMRIMDEGEAIQEAVDRSQQIMDQLAPLRGEAEAEQEEAEGDGDAGQAAAQLTQVLQSIKDYFEQTPQSPLAALSEQAAALLEQMKQAPAPAQEAAEAAPEPAPAPAPAPPSGPYFQFPIDVVFQTVYELCTNEAVKKHIKTMWDAQDQFDPAKVESALNEITPKEPDEDNFLNIDLKQVLKSLFQTTDNEKFQGVLKKMAQTSDQIFLEQTLPLEAIPGEAPAAPAAPEPEPAPAPAPAVPAAPAGPSPEMIEAMTALTEAIAQTAQAPEPPQLPEDLMELLDQAMGQSGESCNIIDPDLLHQLTEAEDNIRTSVNAIIESLSFQDLSGQTIYRIVRLLSDFQVQLLAMVVSFGSKIKAKESKSEITVDESEKLAQEEVDRVLGGLSSAEEKAEGAEGSEEELDQGAVNDLLESLGF